jgi:hypothetical protein
MVNGHWSLAKEDLFSIPFDHSRPIRVKKGYDENKQPQEVYPDHKGAINIELKELERLVLQLNGSNFEKDLDSFSRSHLTLNTKHSTLKNASSHRYTYSGYLVVGNALRPLPVGSAFDSENGVFYWQPGPGFLGEYEFVFIKENGTSLERVRVKVNILPKH